MAELWVMREGAWNKMSSLMCLIGNINRDSKKQRQPFTEADFHPVLQKVKKKPLRSVKDDYTPFINILKASGVVESGS